MGGDHRLQRPVVQAVGGPLIPARDRRARIRLAGFGGGRPLLERLGRRDQLRQCGRGRLVGPPLAAVGLHRRPSLLAGVPPTARPGSRRDRPTASPATTATRPSATDPTRLAAASAVRALLDEPPRLEHERAERRVGAEEPDHQRQPDVRRQHVALDRPARTGRPSDERPGEVDDERPERERRRVALADPAVDEPAQDRAREAAEPDEDQLHARSSRARGRR